MVAVAGLNDANDVVSFHGWAIISSSLCDTSSRKTLRSSCFIMPSTTLLFTPWYVSFFWWPFAVLLIVRMPLWLFHFLLRLDNHACYSARGHVRPVNESNGLMLVRLLLISKQRSWIMSLKSMHPIEKSLNWCRNGFLYGNEWQNTRLWIPTYAAEDRKHGETIEWCYRSERHWGRCWEDRKRR